MTAARGFSRANVVASTVLVVAAIIASSAVVGVSARNPTARAWGFVPLLASFLIAWSVQAGHWRAAWTSIGTIWGVIVLGLLSIGSWFVPAGLIAVGLGTATLRRFSRLPAAILCFALGATGVFFVNSAYSKSHEYTISSPNFSSSVRIILSPVEQFGSALFLFLITATILVTWIRGPRRT